MTLTGQLIAISHSVPGFGEFLLSHSYAMYYSPSQWCSVGYVIHNLKLPKLKHIIWGHGSPIYLSLTQNDRLGPSHKT